MSEADDEVYEPTFIIPRYLFNEITDKLRRGNFDARFKLADRMDRLMVLASSSTRGRCRVVGRPKLVEA